MILSIAGIKLLKDLHMDAVRLGISSPASAGLMFLGSYRGRHIGPFWIETGLRCKYCPVVDLRVTCRPGRLPACHGGLCRIWIASDLGA